VACAATVVSVSAGKEQAQHIALLADVDVDHRTNILEKSTLPP